MVKSKAIENIFQINHTISEGCTKQSKTTLTAWLVILIVGYEQSKFFWFRSKPDIKTETSRNFLSETKADRNYQMHANYKA